MRYITMNRFYRMSISARLFFLRRIDRAWRFCSPSRRCWLLPLIALLDSGVTRVAVTRGGNWRCHPYFFLSKTGATFFSVIATKWLTTDLSCRLVTTPQLRSSHLTSCCPVFFVNSATLFHFGVTPWMVSPGAVRPPSDPTIARNDLTC